MCTNVYVRLFADGTLAGNFQKFRENAFFGEVICINSMCRFLIWHEGGKNPV